MDATSSTLLKEIANHLTPPVWYSNYDIWNMLILSITALIIFLYTLETKKLRVEAQKTNKYSFRPVIVAKYIFSEYGGRRDLKIKNIGKGPALNIECRISQIQKKGGYTNLRDLNPNEKFNNLSPDEMQIIRRITTIDQYSKAEESEFKHGIADKFVIIFTYEDIARFRYQTVTLIEMVGGTPVIKTTVTKEYDSGNLARIA